MCNCILLSTLYEFEFRREDVRNRNERRDGQCTLWEKEIDQIEKKVDENICVIEKFTLWAKYKKKSVKCVKLKIAVIFPIQS